MRGSGPIALVTGAGSGIGRATAIAFLRAGYRVALAGRRFSALEETGALAGAGEGQAYPFAADVTDPAAVRALFGAVKAEFGRLDVLFNNAGTNIPGPLLEDITYEQWRTVLDSIVTGSFLCTQEAVRIMKDQEPRGGRIINNGSLSAHAPRPDSAPYTAAKHAITGLTKATSLDGRKYGIACGQIDIGNAVTGLSSRLGKGAKQADGTIKAEPMIDAAIVAEAVLHIAGLPPEANVQFMTVMATNMPFIGRG